MAWTFYSLFPKRIKPKSKILPNIEPGQVVEVTADTFNDIVLNPVKDVLIEFYTNATALFRGPADLLIVYEQSHRRNIRGGGTSLRFKHPPDNSPMQRGQKHCPARPLSHPDDQDLPGEE